MPPWLASATGAPLAHSRRLSDHDRAALLDWLDHGAPREVIALGQPAMTSVRSGHSGPAAPAAPSHDPSACDSSIRIAQDWQIGADPGMQLRTFAMMPHEEIPKYIQGIELDADAPGVVHSVSFVWDQRGYGLRLDASDPQPGYDAVGDIGLQASGAGGTVSRLKIHGACPRDMQLKLRVTLRWSLKCTPRVEAKWNLLPSRFYSSRQWNRFASCMHTRSVRFDRRRLHPAAMRCRSPFALEIGLNRYRSSPSIPLARRAYCWIFQFGTNDFQNRGSSIRPST